MCVFAVDCGDGQGHANESADMAMLIDTDRGDMDTLAMDWMLIMNMLTPYTLRGTRWLARG